MAKQKPKIGELSVISLSFLENLHRDFWRDPASVPAEWHGYFREMDSGDSEDEPAPGPSLRPRSVFAAGSEMGGSGGNERDLSHEFHVACLQDRVDQLIHAYRVRGHLAADIDPLDRPRPHPPEFEPEFYGLEGHLDQVFSTETIHGTERLTLRQIVGRMRNTYCRAIGAQVMHITDVSVRRWLLGRMEGSGNRIDLNPAQKTNILFRMIEAVVFEDFIQKKFIGAKSFSLEGSESLIPLLDFAVEKASGQEVREVVLAMAHRGRLNVLATIMGKKPSEIFREFEDRNPKLQIGRGDVKYHLGHSAERKTAAGRKVHLSLCFNPSHLEAVNPVALGRVRAKQDRAGDMERRRCAGILIHGDASFAGQGVLQEAFNMSQLPAYGTGGTLHVIVNNQIGFTTPAQEARSSSYASDVAKMLDIPVFHVNGEDPEAVAHVVDLAMDFRMEFGRDVVIDMYCYRRRGHNEGDEPSFTQPLMYREIEKKKPVHQAYLTRLVERGETTDEKVAEASGAYRSWLERELSSAREEAPAPPAARSLRGVWKDYLGGPEEAAEEASTRVEAERLMALLERQTKLPADFRPHRKIVRAIERRKKMAKGEIPLDWSAAEALCFATLATEGVRIRLSGQDSARGTFSQRHAVLFDFEDGRPYAPLRNLDEGQAPVEIINSPLSEAGVLGFEYGYSLDYPDALVLWEAQFGDFCNAAQVIIDQFIASAEDKWRCLSGLVLLLPHGFEGMGPEHSSARLERFLALAAEDNIQVVNPTTPAQYFHCLRRQALRRWRKPLIVMTPKSLLRHPRCVSDAEELSGGGFQRIIPNSHTHGGIKRILLCSGKIFYELAEAREKLGRRDTAILRVEQLYPLPDEVLHAALAPYPDGVPAIWVQEEPENMGAWRHLRARFGERLLGRLPFHGVCRPASASPATGSLSSHKLEQERVIMKAFGDAHA